MKFMEKLFKKNTKKKVKKTHPNEIVFSEDHDQQDSELPSLFPDEIVITKEKIEEYKKSPEPISTEEKNKQQEIENKWYNRNKKAKSLEKRDIDEAIRLYELNVKEKSDIPCTYNRLAILYRKKKDYDNEIRIHELFLKIPNQHRINPKTISQHKRELKKAKTRKKGLHKDKEKNKKPRTRLKRAPKKQLERNKLGKEYEEKGKISEAIKIYEENVKEGTTSPTTYNRLWRLYYDKDMYEDLIRVMNSAITVYEKIDGQEHKVDEFKNKKGLVEDKLYELKVLRSR